MLGNFKIACRNFYRHRMTNVTVDHALHEQLRQIKEENAAIQELPKRSEATEGTAGLEHGRRNPGLVIPAKRTFIDLSDDGSDTLTQGSNKRAFLVEQLKIYEAEMHAKLEREVQDLKAKLADQEAKTSAANVKAIREKNKRRTAREQRDEWKAKHAAEQKSNEAARAEHIKEEEGREDWKSMLFEQERRTEEYKLKYIALEDERKAWEARSVKQENTIIDRKTKFLDQEKEAMALKTELTKLTERGNVSKNASKTDNDERRVDLIEMEVRLDGLSNELKDRKNEREVIWEELRARKGECLSLRAWKQKRGGKSLKLAEGDPTVGILVEMLKDEVQAFKSKHIAVRVKPSDETIRGQRKHIADLDAKLERMKEKGRNYEYKYEALKKLLRDQGLGSKILKAGLRALRGVPRAARKFS